jgi:hypothetical protein
MLSFERRDRFGYQVHNPHIQRGPHQAKTEQRLNEAVRLFLEEAERMGTLDQILREAGYHRTKQRIASPKFSVQRVTLPLPLTHAKA